METEATHYCTKCTNFFCKFCIQTCANCDFDYCKQDFGSHDCTFDRKKKLICQQCKVDFEVLNKNNICDVCEFYTKKIKAIVE